MTGVFFISSKGGVYLATVSTGLELMDRFTRPLNAVNTALQNTVRNSERLRTAISQRMTVNMDATGAMRQIEQMHSRIRQIGPGAVINIVVNAADVENKIRQIQSRLRGMFTNAAVNVTLNAGDITGQARRIRAMIDRQLNNITARIRLDMPMQLEAMFGNLQRLVLQLIRVVRQLRVASGDNTAQLQNALQRIAALEAQILQLQGRLNNRIRDGTRESSGFLSNIQAIAAAYLSIAGAQKLFSGTVGAAMEQKKMEDMFIARTGDTEVGKVMFEKFKSDALAAGQDVTKSLQSSLSFFSTTQNVDQLTKLNNLAQRMNAFDSAGNGIEGAAFALKEAMSGDIVSLAERFNMSKTDIRAFKIDEYGKAGDMDNFIKAFDQLLEKQKMGQAAFDTMMASPAKQVEVLGNNMKSMFAGAGVAAMEALLPVITMLNTAFQNGAFDAFFANLSAGLSWVVESALQVYGVISQIYGFFSTNWGTIEPIIYGIAAAMGVWYLATKSQVVIQMAQSAWTGITTAAIFIQTAATTGLAGAWTMLNAAMRANIIIAIIALVAGLATYIYHLWKTNDAFAAGFMRTWNAILNFFNTIPAYFWTVVEGIAKAFSWMAKSVGGIFDAVINSIISGINSVLSLINSLTGSSYEIAAKFSFENIADDALSYAGAQKDAAYSSAAAKAAEREQAVVDMINSRQAEREAAAAAKTAKTAGGAQPYDFSAWNKAADAARTPMVDDGKKKKNIGKVDKVGKIEKAVDISSEDLKTMRELAEMKNIQNYVTLTPTIQVTTGDINNGMDIDTIVSRIEDVMTNEISTHASGVYGNGR